MSHCGYLNGSPDDSILKVSSLQKKNFFWSLNKAEANFKWSGQEMGVVSIKFKIVILEIQ